jgi:hypothetical protein
VQEHRALITAVGRDASRNPSNLARASQQLRKTPGGAMLGWCSDSRFAFVVAAEALSFAAGALHEEFFGHPDAAIVVPNRASVLVMEGPSHRPDVYVRNSAATSVAIRRASST